MLKLKTRKTEIPMWLKKVYSLKLVDLSFFSECRDIFTMQKYRFRGCFFVLVFGQKGLSS